MEPGPSSLSSSVSGKSSIRIGLISSELARALKERLQVTSGDETLRVLPDGSMEKTVLSCLAGLAFLASSMTWTRLSLSIIGWAGFVCCCGCCSLFLRTSRARSPSEGASSCAEAVDGQRNTQSGTQTETTMSAPSATNRKLGNLDAMISVAERRVRAQRDHIERLGEMERKKSYRRDTVVLALLGTGKWHRRNGHGRAQIEATRNGARPSPFTYCYLQQDRGTETGDRIGYSHWLTLKNPAQHRNPQCRITQMRDFHTISPRRTFTGERLRRSRREINLPLVPRRV